METEEAKEMFNDIVELCYETENKKLIEIVEPIYRDVENSNDLLEIIILAEDLQVHFNEIELSLDEEEQIKDMHEIIEKLSE